MKVELNDKDVENFLFFVDVALKQLGVTHAEIATSLILKLKAAKMQAEKAKVETKNNEIAPKKDTIKKTIESDESRTAQP